MVTASSRRIAIETRLAKGDSARIPIANDVDVRSRVKPEAEFMKADFPAAAKDWDGVAQKLEIFPTGE